VFGLVAGLLAGLAGGCREAPAPPHGMVLALASDPQSLDPRFGSDANSARLADLLHVALTRPDASSRRRPELAAGWEMPDPTTFVFRLRRDFRFADGSPVTAADVRATYEAVQDPALASPKRAALAMLAGIETPDDATVVMHLAEPFAPFLDATGIGILPAGRAREPGEVAVGAGPFRLVRAERGDRLVLAPNPGYPGAPAAIDPLVVRIVPDEVVRVLELGRGGIHLVEDAPEPEMVAWLGARPHLRVDRTPGTSFAYLALNLRDPRLAERRVRRRSRWPSTATR
jgi:peptide/nickel transport system substrate-binding protein